MTNKFKIQKILFTKRLNYSKKKLNFAHLKRIIA